MNGPRFVVGPRFVIGVDVGGTFTDVFVLDQQTGTATTAKVASTPQDQSAGFLAGVRSIVPDLANVASIVHGTTVGTNALLERRGARTGLITTAGFRDVLEMRRRDRPTTWGLDGGFAPVIPRDLRREVAERVLADGSIAIPLDRDAVAAAVQALLAEGCEALCLVFVNGHANPGHEQTATRIARALWPNPHVTSAVELLPEIREFERCSTAALNAYLQPPVSSYLQRLQAGLTQGGLAGQVMIVQSNGGVMSADDARRFPVRTALSGPAAGVIAAAEIGRAAGLPDLITCDMGGTSFDVCLIAAGVSAMAAETSIDFGLVVRSPMIEITTIGAGGGSIAFVDDGGMLQVGPRSAGSSPGPACYGQGGTAPTVTDANLVLGRINPDRPIGSGSRLDVAAAERAIAAGVGDPLGLGMAEAAEAIIRVANSKMAGAIRLVSIERGHDPKRFHAMPFGGGGALHAGALLREVGLAGAIIPRFPGVTSALGCVMADMREDRTRTVNRALDEIDLHGLAADLHEAASRAAEAIARSGAGLEGIETRFALDMLYAGQTHTVAVPIRLDAAGGVSRGDIAQAFAQAYRAAFGRVLEGLALRVMTRRVSVIGRRPKFDLATLAPAPGGSIAAARLAGRPVFVAGAWRPAEVFDRLALPVGATIDGPALLEQADATIFIDPGLQGRVDALGNLIITRVAGS